MANTSHNGLKSRVSPTNVNSSPNLISSCSATLDQEETPFPTGGHVQQSLSFGNSLRHVVKLDEQCWLPASRLSAHFLALFSLICVKRANTTGNASVGSTLYFANKVLISLNLRRRHID